MSKMKKFACEETKINNHKKTPMISDEETKGHENMIEERSGKLYQLKTVRKALSINYGNISGQISRKL